ncbi:MAG: sodium-dependent transporter [Planctomycetota bacterium]|jgi:NSS family neurotransmitter:Na+ symporter
MTEPTTDQDRSPGAGGSATGGPHFSSSLGLILAALGMAIGTGNIWRFPRVLAANGGGAFLIPWAIFLFSWSIPLLMVEFGLGRRARRGPVGAFATVFGPRSAFLGLFVAMCTILIMFYYSVVTGWCLRYLLRGIVSGFADLTPETSEAYFTTIASGPGAVLGHLVAIALAASVVLVGVTRGIERVCGVLIPALLGLVIIAAVRALTLPGAERGIDFVFGLDPARLLDHRTWLEALSQSAWSTGAGWGLLLCYAIYAPPRQRPGLTSAATGIGNNLASLVAALAIVPAVFALMPLFIPLEAGAVDAYVRGQLEQSGPGLTGVTFVWMPVLLERLDLAALELGRWPAVLFFLSLTFAALSSMIALVELATRLLQDLGMRRRPAVGVVLAVGFLCGIPSALSMDVFLNQDWVWGLGLILSGGFFTWGVLRYGAARFRHDFLRTEGRGPGPWFDLVIVVLIPLQFLLLMGWWFYQAYQWTADGDRGVGARLLDWLDPTAEFSIGTCLAQWGALLAVGLILNRRLARAAGAPERAP